MSLVPRMQMSILQLVCNRWVTLKESLTYSPARWFTLQYDCELLCRRPPQGGVHCVRAQDAEQLLHRLHLAMADQTHSERSHLAEEKCLTRSQEGGASTFNTDWPLESNDTSSGLRTQYRLGSHAAAVPSSRSSRGALLSLGSLKRGKSCCAATFLTLWTKSRR